MGRLRIGTRGSALALAQARLVAELLGESPGAELVTIQTAGDRAATEGGTPPREAPPGAPGASGDKSRWVLELEQALAEGEIDLAVHSAKDVPGELAAGLALLGAPTRAAPEDVICGAAGLEELEEGARVGTSSVRRAAQLRAVREDLKVVTIRGNVDTRLRKLHERWTPAADGARSVDGAGSVDGFDAIVLARAGLQRLGREDEIGAVLDPARFVPSPGQGTLALEGRTGDERVVEAVREIVDERAFACLRAERAVARALEAGCDTPLGAHARDAGCGCLHLRAWVGLPDGSAWVSDELHGGFYDPEELGRRIAERLRMVGADELLRRAESVDVVL
jgi:hydroxymethylbilane synthase